MKKLILIIIVFVIIIAVSYNVYDAVKNNTDIKTETSANGSASNSAADFTVYDTNGNSIQLSDMKGKPTVVNFWATWCPPCKEELPYFNTLAKELGDRINFMMVNVEADNEDNVIAFIRNNSYTFPVYHDKEQSASKAYGVSSIPLTLFIDKDGNIVDSRIGSMSEKMLRDYIAEIDK